MMRLPILITFLLLSKWGDAGGRNRSGITRRYGNPFQVRDPVEEQKILAGGVKTRERIRRTLTIPHASFLMSYCWEFRFSQTNDVMLILPRAGYAERHYDPDRNIYRWTWSVWTEKVEAVKYAGGSLAVVVLDEKNNARPPLAPLVGVLVTDPEQSSPDLATKYAVLLPGHYRWGEQVTQETAVYLPSPGAPEYWCRVWASASRMTVHHGQNYTVVQTLETLIPNEPTQPAVLLQPDQRASHMIPFAKCTAFGFPEGNTDLRRVEATVVACEEVQIPHYNPNVISQEETYFCTELHQDLNEDFEQGVGWRWEAEVEWEVPKERRWPIYCQNWTNVQNSVYSDEVDETVFLAGFLWNLKVIKGRAFARAQYI